ncbi:chaperone protein dnaJ 20, chloroplastic-like [Corylus avellana]|uniref:chaperone protein dnaJ 20, chloroplastic-like n=1 Tax=Corylus avellana TaxID=13451 RepID=UPI001E1F72EE|nr:chaperone protein dnaJ 20, chloroplastic-like [Corylus avellana]
MEISLRMNPRNIATLQVPKLLHKTISCRAANYDQLAMQKKNTNFYEVLSLRSENVGFDEIKKAYRNLALQCHPDVCPDPSAKVESTRRFVEVRKAYETLSDPISRKVYDHKLGLVKSMGSEAEGAAMESRFSKKVWENQLYGLKKRSQVRMHRKRCGYMQKQ